MTEESNRTTARRVLEEFITAGNLDVATDSLDRAGHRHITRGSV